MSMAQKVRSWWADAQDGLWLIPTLLTVIAVVAAIATVRVDQLYTAQGRAAGPWWAFGGGAEGARGVLAAIAGTTVTVTGVVFSLTVIALQLASGQFTPRVLRGFTGDRGNQVVLGVLIATFTYALLVLRSVRSATDAGALFVPGIGVTVAIVLALMSVAAIIYYIHHIARTIQASVIIDRAASETLALVEEHGGRATRPLPPTPPSAAVVSSPDGGYIQSVDREGLLRTARGRGATVRVVPAVGDFVLPGGALAAVWPASALDDDLEDAVRAGVPLGIERTLHGDTAFGLRLLADIAIKALSPGVNDPTTAILCVDRLGEILVRVAARPAGDDEPDDRTDRGQEAGRVIVADPPYGRLVEVAFAQIRHYGVGDPTVAAHLLTRLGEMAALVPPAERPPLVREACLVLEGAREEITIGADLARVEQAGAWLPSGATGPK